ncbi:hypothetical protein PMIN03_011458 [Paraphaeosphaeria minitans]|uniref:Uncharacterized protein n=1 Tax=Paraphaeosphaeria minitans TaxID=565426 RepID=A0A9P6KL29_9PLEO|nr:hypothetical protein PMIN01_11052 [Paraphaeosphaeria minitans]
MSSWLHRLRGQHVQNNGTHVEQSNVVDRSRAKPRQRPVLLKPKDPNAPRKRLQLHQTCLYERTMPGDAFVSAHVNRLQRGHYQSKALHEGPLNNVYFVSVHFVFHPRDHHYHRFRAATIQVSVHTDFSSSDFDPEKGRYRPLGSHPRILKHAPELIYGAVSPENLQWNFNLSSSLGVSQAPLSATLNPSGGVKKTYRVYDMMSIQGSLRVLKSPLGSDFDVDDAMAVWTIEENLTQRSGLPREFDFVVLVHKPDHVRNVYLSVDLDATVSSWHGDYPQWYTNLSRYLPNVDYTLDLETDIGQKFLPEKMGCGFNFAHLPQALDQYVCMPGTMYPTTDSKPEDPRSGDRNWSRYREYEPRGSANDYRVSGAAPTTSPEPMSPEKQINTWGQPSGPTPASAPTPQRQLVLPESLNVRVTLEHSTPRSPATHRYSRSPISSQDPARQHSIRRRRSQSELKEYGVQQALRALADDTLKEKVDVHKESGKDGKGKVYREGSQWSDVRKRRGQMTIVHAKASIGIQARATFVRVCCAIRGGNVDR